MAFEAGTLLARIQVSMEGTEQVVRSAGQVAEAVRSVEGPASTAGAALDQMSGKLSLTAEGLQLALGRLVAAQERMNELGGRQAGMEAASEAGQQRIVQIENEARALNELLEAGQPLDEQQQQRMVAYAQEYALLINRSKAYKDLSGLEKDTLKRWTDMTNQQQKLQGAIYQTQQSMSGLAARFQQLVAAQNAASQGGGGGGVGGGGGGGGLANLGRLWGAAAQGIMTGNFSAAVLTRALAGIGLAAGPITAVTAGVVKLAAAIGQGMQTAIRQSHLPELSRELDAVADSAGIAETALKGIVTAQSNILESVGLDEKAIDKVATLANELRFLTQSKSLPDATQALTQGLASGNVTQIAREFGFNAPRMENMIGDTSQMTDMEKATRVWVAVLAEAQLKIDDITKAQNDSVTSVEHMKSAWQDLMDQIGESMVSEKMAQIGEDIVEGAHRWFVNIVNAFNEFDNWVYEQRTGKQAVDYERLQFDPEAADKEAADVLKELEDGLEGTSIPDNFKAAEEAARAFDKAIQELQATSSRGFGLVDSAVAAADAMMALNKEFNPRNAMNYFQTLQNQLNQALEGNVEPTLEMMRERVASSTGLSQREKESVLRDIQLVEDSYGPAIRQANRMREETEGFNSIAGQGMNTLTTSAGAAKNAVDATTTAVNTLRASAADPINIMLNFGVTGSFGIPGFGAMSSGMQSGSQGLFGEGGIPSNFTFQKPKPPPVPRYLQDEKQQSLADQRGAFDRAAQKRADDANAELWKRLGAGSKPSGGGGGGGGGAKDDFAATLEQIRALMRAVNEAVMIGIRGGVRLGTQGNVVPFEPGSFLNASGNQLTVDTIVIRGVWDFADPATRRQIVKELEQALRELKAEL
jgi:hypothetical protein